RSLELDPSNALLMFDIGVLNCNKGEVTAADEAFAKAAELNPSLDWKSVAKVLMGFNMIASARDAYEKVVDKDPGPANQLAYGELLEALGQEEEAMKAYDSAILGYPGMGKAHLRKALLLTGTGLTNLAALHAGGLNREEAKAHLKKALVSGDEAAVGPAADALEFIEMEEREVEQWRQHVANLPPASLPTQGSSADPDVGGGDAVTPPWVERQGGYLEVPEVAVGSAEELMGEFVNRSRPAVVKNFQSEFAPKDAWSWEALAERFGDSVVRVSLSETGRFDGPEDGEAWGLPSGEEVLVRPPGTSMAFSDFVELLRRAEGLRETFYLEYLAVHQYLG
ncbi:unnamed protein product, partial [Sphacelaria rigidula]